MMSSELDILVVGYNDERFSTEIRQAFRHWQVYAVAAPHAIKGRRFRRAYFTEGATQHPNWSHVAGHLRRAAVIQDATVMPYSDYRAEYDVQSYQDAQLARAITRSRYASV